MKHDEKKIYELIDWIQSQPKFKPKADLDRMKQALKQKEISLDHTYKIHVAGTNGKGSTVAFLTEICLAKGLRVGTFSSPYILEFSERICINGKKVSSEELLDLLRNVKDFNETFYKSYGESLSFFELLTLAAYSLFQKEKLDVVIIEVGIGGLLDATNALDYYDLSLITNIGFDHMTQLGNTLTSIAYNKLGILRENGRLITTVDANLHDYFKAYTEVLNVDMKILEIDAQILSEEPLSFSYKRDIYTSGLMGDYQLKNAILAIEAAKAMPFNINVEQIKKGLKSAFLPARFMMIKPDVIVDGAHNEHAISALKNALKQRFSKKKIHLIYSALGDKDIKAMLVLMESFADHIDLVSFPDSRFRSLKPYETDLIKYHPEDVVSYVKNKIAHKSQDEVIVITGSLHFAGYILKHLK